MSDLPPMDKYLLRGAASTLILAILNEQPTYGYQLAQEIRGRSHGLLEFEEATIYPLLYALEADGFLKASWGPGVGERRRKTYRLTAAGRKELERRLAAWERYELGMRMALRGA